MAIGLWNDSAVKISDYVSVLHYYEANQIWNRTLDGQPHVQTIGTAAEIVEVEMWAYKAGKDMLDLCYATGEPVTVSDNVSTWRGLVKEAPRWEKAVRTVGLFKTLLTLEILVAEEE